MALPPAALPQQEILQQLAAARAGMPTYEDLSTITPFQQFKPLFTESPTDPTQPPDEAPSKDPIYDNDGNVIGEYDPATGESTYFDEEGQVQEEPEGGMGPGGMTKEEWEAKKQAALDQMAEETGQQPGEFSGEAMVLAMALEAYEKGGTLSEEHRALLKQYGIDVDAAALAQQAKNKIADGNYNLLASEYGAMKDAGEEIYTPEEHKWELQEDGTWKLRKMTEDEYLDYQMDQVAADIADDSKFYDSLDAYAAQMQRQLSEAQFLAGGQMSSAGLWQTGLGARRMMQIESAAMAEMSATMSDMIVQHQQAKWQAKLQWLQGQTSLWAQRKSLEMQATLSSFNAAMQGADTFKAWLDAEGMGDYMNEYWAKVEACQEAGDISSITCVFSLYEEFRVDHEGNLGWGGPSAGELYDINAHKEASAVQKCGNCAWPPNWSCCINQSDADEEFEHTAPNPSSGKVYKAGGKKAYG